MFANPVFITPGSYRRWDISGSKGAAAGGKEGNNNSQPFYFAN